jgi:hypothetical protein
MKHRPWIILSLGLNLLLAVAVVWAAKFRPATTVRPAIAESITNRVVRTRPVTEAAAAVVEVTAPFHWAQIESTDYRAYIANLRAIGCPEATIHDIVEADVNDLFSGRVKQMVDGVTGLFWNVMANPKGMEKLVKDKMQELDSLADQRREMMRELFVEDDPQSKVAKDKQRADQLANLKWQLGSLPEAKVAQIQDVYDRFAAEWAELTQRDGNVSPAERQKRSKEWSARKDREIAALLTPEEYEEYTLRTTAAADVRHRLSDVEVSDEETRAIALAKMKAQGDDAIKQLLGADRFAAYQRASDNVYQQTRRITDRFELPVETAVQVCQMQKDAQAQASAIRSDRSRTVEERQELLQAMQAETEQSLSAALGPKIFKAYQKYNGDWLKRFTDGVR